MAKAVYFFLLTIILFANFAPSILRSNAIVTWHDPQLPYRISHVISNQTGAGVPYQMNFTVHYSSGVDTATHVYLSNKSQTDFRDLRFYGSNGSLLSAWNESTVTGSYVQVWIKVLANLSAASETVYLYFGNSGYASYWNATAVFQRVINSGVVLALPMNEGAGNPQDYSGNGNHGTLGADPPTWVTTGKFGNALDFDGDFITCNDSASLRLLGAHSYVAWVYLDSYPAAANTIARKFDAGGDGYMFRVRNTNKLNTQLLTGWAANLNLDGTATFTLTAWHCNIHTLDAGLNANVYMDSSVSRGTAVSTANAGDSTGRPLYIGESEAAIESIDGKLNGLFLFNYALSSAEIDDFVSNYPQCSSSNLGSLFLRSFVNPEPQNAAWGTLETNFVAGIEDSTGAVMVFGLIGAIGLIIVLLLVWKR